MVLLLEDCIENVTIPTPDTKIYKDECIYSFDNKFSQFGIYYCLKNHVAVGRKYIHQYSAQQNSKIFINFRALKIPQCPDNQKSPKRLAIGVDGGFNTDVKYKELEWYTLVFMPRLYSLDISSPDIPLGLVDVVQNVIQRESAYKTLEKSKHSGKWEGEVLQDSIVAKDLFQEEFKGPCDLSRCAECDLETNLWINLSDGTVRCGRGYFDGSGGRNHSMDHFLKSGYPLVVKLGTISPESPPDIYSYVESNMVLDPYLGDHLEHWGIDLSTMVKSDKTMVELEIELNSNHQWASMRESDQVCTPLYGQGLTGIHNIGNTCYIACVLQILASIKPFVYCLEEKLSSVVKKLSSLNDIHTDPFFQLGKIVAALESGDYSTKPPVLPNGDIDLSLTGIFPVSYVNALSGVHSQFGNGSQQDAYEFMQYLFDALNSSGDACANSLSRLFCFETLSSITCAEADHPTTALRHIRSPLNSLSLFLTNGEKDGDLFESFEQCITRFTEGDIINNYYSSIVDRNVEAVSTTRFISLPQVLVIRLCRFTVNSQWQPFKIDTPVSMPENIDLSALMTSLPSSGNIEISEKPSVVVDDEKLVQLLSMGYELDIARTALAMCENDLNNSLDWIFSHLDDYGDFIQVEKTRVVSAGDLEVEKSSGMYRMFAFVSHVGSSTERGHYLSHILKDGQWVIFDDAKVCKSVCPRPELGYIFFYERL